MAADGVEAGPSEAELEQILAQMREAPAEQVLVEVFNVLLQAAQVKLGRPDARLLIDTVVAVAQAAAGRADQALLGQVGQAVTQLRLAQVEAEGGSVAPSPAPSSAADAADPRAAGPQRSRLWTPGT